MSSLLTRSPAPYSSTSASGAMRDSVTQRPTVVTGKIFSVLLEQQLMSQFPIEIYYVF